LSFLVFLVLEEGDTQEGTDEEEDTVRLGKLRGRMGGDYVWWPQLVKVTKSCGEREGRELANEGGGQLGNPVNISTG
jgi:hypothetical protein